MEKLVILVRRYGISIQISCFYPMKFLSYILIAMCAFIQAYGHDPASDMAAAAKRFLNSSIPRQKKLPTLLSKVQKEKIGTFSPAFIRPDGRQGLSLKDMSPAQKTWHMVFWDPH